MALIWVTVSMVVLIGLVGLALDAGFATLAGGQLQHAADAAALAAAQVVYQNPGTVRSTAAAIGGRNTVTNSPLVIDTNADVTIGTVDGTQVFSAGGRAPNAVQVVAKRTTATSGAIPLFFGAVFGTPNLDMTRSATAMIATTGTPAVVVLDSRARCALAVTGGCSLTVMGGPIQVNSGHNSAACVTGNSSVYADALDCCGGHNFSNNPTIDILANDNQAAIPDPLAALPAPPFPAGQPGVDVTVGVTQTLDPGYYTGGLSVRGTCYLNPGIYILGTPGLKVNSGASLIGDGVMIYIADGSFDSSSTGATTQLTPPNASYGFTGSDTYAGVLVFQARGNNTSSSISLNGSLKMSGTMYFPAAEFDVASGGAQFGVRLIASQVKCSGNGTILFNCRSNGVTDGKPFLVE
jgi:hypothetical protein